MSKRKSKGNSGAEGLEPRELTAEVEVTGGAGSAEEASIEEPKEVDPTGEIEKGQAVNVEQQVLPVEAVSPANPPIGAKRVVREILDKRFANVKKLEIENIPEPLKPEEVAEADHNERDGESEVDQLSLLDSQVVEQEVPTQTVISSASKNEGDDKGVQSTIQAAAVINEMPVVRLPEKAEDHLAVESTGKSTSSTSAINEAILREDSAFTVSQTRKGSFGSMGAVFKKYKTWMLWGGVAVVGVVCLGGLAFSALTSNSNKEQGNKETAQTSQVNPLSIWSDGYAYGYQQNRGQPASWWIASITPVDSNHFNITWNGDRETGSGKGTGLGSGKGIIQPDAHVEINIDENVLNSGGFSFSLGGQQTPTQLLQLKGKYIQQGSLSYFIGHDIRRGNRFDPETTWVLMRKLPPGWKKPETAP
jgi:hypothetical protein